VGDLLILNKQSCFFAPTWMALASLVRDFNDCVVSFPLPPLLNRASLFEAIAVQAAAEREQLIREAQAENDSDSEPEEDDEDADEPTLAAPASAEASHHVPTQFQVINDTAPVISSSNNKSNTEANTSTSEARPTTSHSQRRFLFPRVPVSVDFFPRHTSATSTPVAQPH
jgi:hypothetical protein